MPSPGPSLSPVPSDGDFIFVYGALMRGCELHHHMSGAAFVAPATTRGKLFKLGAYPGMIEGDGTVRGEVYASDDPAVLLEVLDEVEGYDPLDYSDTSEYIRVKRSVRTDDGRELAAWLYLYNRSTSGCEPIKSGDWHAP